MEQMYASEFRKELWIWIPKGVSTKTSVCLVLEPFSIRSLKFHQNPSISCSDSL